MYEVGQEVVIMGLPGRFRIVAVDGDKLVLENDAGIRKVVHERAARLARRPEGGDEAPPGDAGAK